MDRYRTIKGPGEGIYKDRGSKFIAYARRVVNREEAEALLQEARKNHFKARHHCLAYRIGLDEVEERASDDGEPSGSAGIPILNQLKSQDLLNLAVVVVRYFGGSKLGIPGLIKAYGASTDEALRNAGIIDHEVRHYYLLSFDYKLMKQVMDLINWEGLTCTEKTLDIEASVTIGFLPSEHESGLKKTMSILFEKPEDAIDSITFDHKLFQLKSLGTR
ncbi:MAG: YigZ family protein [Saprospiraceae bacterium]|nr:YigZ family protein [Saprospiraceae bacterium]